jgi:hypothetical protein
MNLVGKIFVVLIFVMSLVFMTAAVFTYATHRNWRDVVLNPEKGLQFQLKEAKDVSKKLETEKESLQTTLDKEKVNRRAALAKLENEVEELKKQRDLDQKKLDGLTKSEREAVATMQALQAAEGSLRKETEAIRAQKRKADQDRDAAMKVVVERTDDLQQNALEMKTLRARNKTLVDDLTKAKSVLLQFNLDPNKDYSNVAPEVDGVVLATLGNGVIEISIGADDGLKKGHVLEVFRQAEGVNKYLGRVEVIQAAPEKSVCKTVPGMQKGTIQVNDRVASKLK